MARRKATQKTSAKQGTPKSLVEAPKFPADLLPSELIHLVFTCLQPTEAAAFRWAGRTVAEIGLQYLVPTVSLALKEESYDRLLAIAEHPIVSKYVVRLDYESEGLGCISREFFDENIHSTRFVPQRYEPARPGTFASARAWRAYERELVRGKHLLSQEQTTQLLDQAWSIYRDFLTNQLRVQQGNFFREKSMKAMKQFQKLKSIWASAHGAFDRYAAELQDLLPTYYISQKAVYENWSNLNPSSSVLLAAKSAGLRVNTFYCRPLRWQIFTQNDNDLAALNRSMLHVRFMDIAFTIRRDLRQQPMNQDVEFIRRECLAKGRVLEFLTSAPDLEYLALAFRTSPRIHPTITATLGNFHWSSLKIVHFDGIVTHENDLVNFFERHSYTLKDFSLVNMVTLEVQWNVIFHGVRRAFRLGQQLHSCRLCGWFSKPGTLRIHMDTMGGGNMPLGIFISDYIRATNVGDISLDEYCEIRGLRF